MRRDAPTIALVLVAAAWAAAQQAPDKPADPPTTARDAAQPDLDELLGLPSKPRQAPPAPDAQNPPAPGEPAPDLDPDRMELERKLTAREMAEKFEIAVRQMGETADRIQRLGDVGLATQRLHEEILRNLDVLIKQSQQGGSSSSSSSRSQPDSERQRARQQGQSKGGQNQQAGSGENRGEAMPPAMQAVQRAGRLDTARAAWGNLPDRVRDSLLEGSSDYFSALYEAMTEAYYKKLAEEAKE